METWTLCIPHLSYTQCLRLTFLLTGQRDWQVKISTSQVYFLLDKIINCLFFVTYTFVSVHFIEIIRFSFFQMSCFCLCLGHAGDTQNNSSPWPRHHTVGNLLLLQLLYLQTSISHRTFFLYVLRPPFHLRFFRFKGCCTSCKYGHIIGYQPSQLQIGGK